MSILVSMLVLLAFANFANFASSQAPLGAKNIFLLAGESNMAGQGGVVGSKWDGVVPPESAPLSAILKFNSGLEWEEAKEPLHAGIDVGVTNGIGPGIPFAKQAFSRVPRLDPIGLVPCAVSGTKIIEWQKGTKLYNQLVKRAKASTTASDGQILGLLWYQGESDTVTKADADAYKGRFERFVADLKADLNTPFVVAVQVALASGLGNFTEEVRQAQLQNGAANVTVDAKGFELQKDNLHLTTAAQVRLGLTLADAFINF